LVRHGLAVKVHGDATVMPYRINGACRQIASHMREVLGDKHREVISTGGDHPIVLPSQRA
jgi:arginase family enzyme